ncbi:hypothetical protein M5D96_000001 [Drosophila gunungcola]|uniref:Homeobox domain-containing protein n=1 Tax=Drosophila gunungcola TaxID=103775 RepID=A0A9P9YVW9_9MUSC|nr:hypothetical protein M5D96_000001 [Drosophila gunungcola]
MGISVVKKDRPEGAFDLTGPVMSPNSILKPYQDMPPMRSASISMSDASEEDSAAIAGATSAAAATAAATVTAATPLDQPLNLCVARKSRDSNNSPMPATKQSHILGKSAAKKESSGKPAAKKKKLTPTNTATVPLPPDISPTGSSDSLMRDKVMAANNSNSSPGSNANPQQLSNANSTLETTEDDSDSGSTDARRKKKARTTFTGRQIFELEKQFEVKKYLSSSERTEMAKLLMVTETQVRSYLIKLFPKL